MPRALRHLPKSSTFCIKKIEYVKQIYYGFIAVIDDKNKRKVLDLFYAEYVRRHWSLEEERNIY